MKSKTLNVARKIHRERDLARQAIVGKRVSRSWGGPPTAKEVRRDKSWKKDI